MLIRTRGEYCMLEHARVNCGNLSKIKVPYKEGKKLMPPMKKLYILMFSRSPLGARGHLCACCGCWIPFSYIPSTAEPLHNSTCNFFLCNCNGSIRTVTKRSWTNCFQQFRQHPWIRYERWQPDVAAHRRRVISELMLWRWQRIIVNHLTWLHVRFVILFRRLPTPARAVPAGVR